MNKNVEMNITNAKAQIEQTAVNVFVPSCIYPPITRKRSKRYNELTQELATIGLPHQDGGIPLNAFPNGTKSKLVG